MRKAIAVLSTIMLLLVSFWLGEAGKGIFRITPYLFGLIGIVAIPYLISKKWKYRALSGFIFIILYAVAFYMGDLSFYQAYNNCIEEAEQIRTTLFEFKDQNGKYPADLDDLNIQLPCSRFLRGTILEYESTASSYKIWFKDWLVGHSATDKEPFITHK
jgi:hypothetical protein